jgi:hypothetical protein
MKIEQIVSESHLNEFAPGGNSASSYYAVTSNFVNEFAQQKQEQLQDLIDAGWTKQDLAQAGTLTGQAEDIAHFEQVRDSFLKGLKPGFDAYLRGDTQMKDQLGEYWLDNDLPLNQDWEKVYGEPWGDNELDENQLNEYLVRAGMPVKDVLALNLFQDFDPVEGAAAQFAEFAEEPMWKQVVRKYAPIANMLKKKLLATKRPLTDAEAEAVEQTWYDGSDAYDDMEIEYLVDIYNQQIDTLEALLAGNLTDEEFGEGVAEGLEHGNYNVGLGDIGKPVTVDGESGYVLLSIGYSSGNGKLTAHILQPDTGAKGTYDLETIGKGQQGVAEGNKFFKPGPATTGKFPEPRERQPGQAWSKSETLGKDGKIYHWQDPRAKQGVAEAEQQKGADYRDPPEADYGDDYQAMVKRMKQLAGAGPLKTVYDPTKRVYKNVPTATQPGAKK